MAPAVDRQAFIDILGEGRGNIGAVLQPAPAGLWGIPPDLLKELLIPGHMCVLPEQPQQDLCGRERASGQNMQDSEVSRG
jgi:hypothetical protein